MRIALVYGNDGSDVRVGKTCRTLKKLGHDVHFVGWDRRPADDKPCELGGAAMHIMARFTAFGRLDWSGQLRFTQHVVRTLRSIRPDIVCAVNEDNAVRLLPFKNLLYDRLYCDVFDSHRDRGSSHILPVRLALTAMSELSWIGADVLIATDEVRRKRFGRHCGKTIVIGNYPEDPGDELAQTELSGETKIAVCGTFTESRGIRHLLAAVEQAGDAQIVAAGWPNDDFASQVFVTHPQVTYHGIVTSRQALELTASCDAAFAFYAPSCRNNILASPNKIYDAMSVGRPVILNSEAEVSRWVVAESLGFACPYENVDDLTKIIAGLRGRRIHIADAASRARRLFSARYSWEKMEERLSAIYGGDGVPPPKVERAANAA